MLRPLLFVILLAVSVVPRSQVILYMDWNSGPVGTANIGPNATSVSSSAISDVSGAGGTNGLNAGSPKADINMDFTGSPTFDVDGIDISIDFQRDESVGDFVSRSGFNFGMNGGSLSVTFRVDDGAGSYINVNSGNIYSIPNDDVFRTYRFYYLPDMGTAAVQVNGADVWTWSGTANRKLYWSGGNLRIGANMDGSGSNKTILDNLVIASVSSSPLPIELISFTGRQKDKTVELEWATASETNNAYFTIDRSPDGKIFDQNICFVQGAGNSSGTIHYACTDLRPENGPQYYRLTQTDFNGVYVQFEPILVFFEDARELITHVSGSLEINLISERIKRIEVIDPIGRPLKTHRNGSVVYLPAHQGGILIVNITMDSGRLHSVKIYM